MRFDIKQAVAAFFTVSMFGMLANMILQDCLDLYMTGLQDFPAHVGIISVEDHSSSVAAIAREGPWIVANPKLKPCWGRPASKDAKQSKGFITFSLTHGPEHHLLQVADAAVIARSIGATLVLPDIKGSELDQKRKFGDMYDTEKFMKSMEGVIKVVRELPMEISSRQPAVVRVPIRVSKKLISKTIEPIFRTKNYLRLAVVFPAMSWRQREKQIDVFDSSYCLAMFESLRLKPELQQIAVTMVNRLRNLSLESDGKFVAIDLKVDVLEKNSCEDIGEEGRKSCYTVQEVSKFLKNFGFNKETTIYLTQTWWHDSLNVLRENFQRIYTKDDILPVEKKGKVLKSGNLERALDYHICSQSDVFVPAISGVFSDNVAAKRIASGTPTLIPSELQSYGTMKDHWAYSCYC